MSARKTLGEGSCKAPRPRPLYVVVVADTVMELERKVQEHLANGYTLGFGLLATEGALLQPLVLSRKEPEWIK